MEEEKKNVGTEVTTEPTGATNATEKKNLIDMINEDKELQSQFDKLKADSMKTAVENAKAKWEEEAKNQKAEAEKLAKMNAEQKAQYEKEQLQKELAEYKKKESARTLKDEALNIMTEKEIPVGYAGVFKFETMTAEEVKTVIDLIENLRKKDRENWLNQNLKQKTPTQKITTSIGDEDPFLKGFNSK